MTYEHPAIYALESVGTMITSKGMTYPMLCDIRIAAEDAKIADHIYWGHNSRGCNFL